MKECGDGYLQERGHLTERETAKIARDILNVLCECHRQNICYADVKPSNFLVKEPYPCERDPDAAPRVKVADFGCSQRVLRVKEPFLPGQFASAFGGVALCQVHSCRAHQHDL